MRDIYARKITAMNVGQFFQLTGHYMSGPVICPTMFTEVGNINLDGITIGHSGLSAFIVAGADATKPAIGIHISNVTLKSSPTPVLGAGSGHYTNLTTTGVVVSRPPGSCSSTAAAQAGRGHVPEPLCRGAARDRARSSRRCRAHPTGDARSPRTDHARRRGLLDVLTPRVSRCRPYVSSSQTYVPPIRWSLTREAEGNDVSCRSRIARISGAKINCGDEMIVAAVPQVQGL